MFKFVYVYVKNIIDVNIIKIYIIEIANEYLSNIFVYIIKL